MEDSLRVAEPVPLARPKGAHRFEAFSPKLGRRLTFYRRALVEQWVLLEADPSVLAFCERPGFVQVDGHKCLADFWVHYVDRDELVLLDNSIIAEDVAQSLRNFDAAALSVRRVASADIAAARMWIDNWQRMLPCIVANRGLVSPSLLPAIERFLRRPQRLLAIEREFSTGDPVLVRTALFGLLHAGRIEAPELHTQALSLLTSFVLKEVDP